MTSDQWSVNSFIDGYMGDEIKSYKDLLVWNKGIELTREIYRVISKFPHKETYVLSDQLRRAAISVPSNIAEGQAREYTPELKQFLYISLGSLAELHTQSIIAKESRYISEKVLGEIENRIIELRKMISKLISRLPANRKN